MTETTVEKQDTQTPVVAEKSTTAATTTTTATANTTSEPTSPTPTKASGTTSTTSSSTSAEFEPPLACVRRMLKNTLPSSTNVGKDASAAFSRACGIFVIYLTACANDFARESKRQTITAVDIMKAVKVRMIRSNTDSFRNLLFCGRNLYITYNLFTDTTVFIPPSIITLQECDFDEFTPQLTEFLENHRKLEKEKRELKKTNAAAATAAEQDKKRKDSQETIEQNDNDETAIEEPVAKKQKLDESLDMDVEEEENDNENENVAEAIMEAEPETPSKNNDEEEDQDEDKDEDKGEDEK